MVALRKQPLSLTEGTLNFLGFLTALIGKPLNSKEIGQTDPLTFLNQRFLNQY